MRLKVVTTAFVILGVLMLLSYPWIVGPVPKGQGKEALAEYAMRFGIYIILSLLVWFTAAVLAVVTARRARQAYREEAMENFQSLMEETLKDHGRKHEQES
jgi:type VI protein secretion system component VasK